MFKIIDFLVDNKGMDFTKKDIAEGAEISRTSLFNYWEELEKHGILRVTRKFGKTRLFTLNSKNPVTKKILDLEMALIKESMNKDSKRKERKITIPIR